MDRAERIFVAGNRWALIIILATMSVVVFANVALRYLTNYSLVWAEELARYLMIWMTFLGVGPVLRCGGHVGIDTLHHLLPQRLARLLRIGLALLMIAFFAVMAWQGFDYMERSRFQTTPAMRISFTYIYAVLPIGFGLLIVHLLLVLRGYVRDHRFAEGDGVSAETAAAI